MPGEILTVNSTILCPHGGQAILTTTHANVKTTEALWLLESDIHPVAGCPFNILLVPFPCIRIEWSGGSAKTKVNGTPVLKFESTGLCYNTVNAMMGTAIIANTQRRVTTQ